MELVAANQMPGGQAKPGATYYGTCGTTQYAAARFIPAPGATFAEKVSFQDDGSAARFFIEAGTAGSWTKVGQDSSYLQPSCATFPGLPPALKAMWQDCLSG